MSRCVHGLPDSRCAKCDCQTQQGEDRNREQELLGRVAALVEDNEDLMLLVKKAYAETYSPGGSLWGLSLSKSELDSLRVDSGPEIP